MVAYGSIFHDIGKIGIEDEIINSPKALSSKEYEKVKEHSKLGFDILYDLKDSYEEKIIYEWAIIARWHHERIDGSGYP